LPAQVTFVVEVVRRAERLQEGARQVGEWPAAIGQRDAAPAMFVDRLAQLVGDVVEGFVPRGAPPLAAAPRAMRISGVCGPLVVVLEGQPGRALAHKLARWPCRACCPEAKRPCRPRRSPPSGNATEHMPHML